MIGLSFAIQLLESELFCLTEKTNLSDSYQQVFILNKKPIKPYYLNSYLLLDKKDELYIINKKINKLIQDLNWEYNYDYIVKIDSQVEFENNINIINEIINKYALGSSIKKINKEYSSNLSLFIVFLKVYKIPKTLKFIKGKKSFNSFLIYKIDELTKGVDIQDNEIIPVISSNYFNYIRDEIIHILKSNGNYLDIYKNNEEGNKKLLKRFELQYAISEKSLKNDEKHHRDMAKTNYQVLYDKVIEIEPNMSFMINKIKSVIPPQSGENLVLLRALRKGDKTVVKRLFESHLRMILNIAYKNRFKVNDTFEDCFQEGAIGLLEAIKKYDIDSGQPFGGYCSYWIMQPMERMDHRIEKAFNIPEHFKNRIIPIYNYLQENNIEINQEGFIKDEQIEQISNEFDIEKEKLKKVIKYCFIPISYEDYCITKLTDDSSFADKMHIELEKKLIIDEFNKIINDLIPREKDIILRRNGLQNHEVSTLQEIADLYGLTRERVRQIEAKALKNIRTKLLKSFIPDYWGYSKKEYLTLFYDGNNNEL